MQLCKEKTSAPGEDSLKLPSRPGVGIGAALLEAKAQLGTQSERQALDQLMPRILAFASDTVQRKFPQLSQADQDNIVQESALKAWRKLSQVDPLRNPASWLWAVTYSTAITYLRAESARREVSNIWDAPKPGSDERSLHSVASNEPCPLSVLIKKEECAGEQAFKDSVLMALGPAVSETVDLRLSGLKYADIAATQHLSLGTVQFRLNLARKTAQELRAARAAKERTASGTH